MTPKERAVMQQALEALEQYHYTLISAGVLDKQHVLNQGFTAHAALREVLADPDIEEMTLTQIAARHEQAEQEPVMDYERLNALREGEQNKAENDYFNARPENDTPTLRKMFCQGFERGFHKGIKYAAPVEPVKQEPVAWMHKDGCVCSAYDKEHMFGLDYFNIPLYAAPVRTKDLTDDEFEWLVVDTLETWNSKDTMKDFARAVIAKFKEKNK